MTRKDLDRCLAMMPELHRVAVNVPRSCWDWPSYIEPSGYAVVKWAGPGPHIDRHVLCNSISGEITNAEPHGDCTDKRRLLTRLGDPGDGRR